MSTFWRSGGFYTFLPFLRSCLLLLLLSCSGLQIGSFQEFKYITVVRVFQQILVHFSEAIWWAYSFQSSKPHIAEQRILWNSKLSNIIKWMRHWKILMNLICIVSVLVCSKAFGFNLFYILWRFARPESQANFLGLNVVYCFQLYWCPLFCQCVWSEKYYSGTLWPVFHIVWSTSFSLVFCKDSQLCSMIADHFTPKSYSFFVLKIMHSNKMI